MIGVIVATVIMVAYLGWYVWFYGIPPSISQTVYMLPHQAIFTLVMFSVVFLTISTMIDACSENTKILAFLTVAGIGFVGAAPLGENCDERVHIGGAIFFGVCSQIMLAINNPSLLLMWVLTMAFLTTHKCKNWLFWVEMTCISDLMLFCLCHS